MLAFTPDPTSVWATLFLDVNTFARHTPWLHTPLTLYAKDGIALFAVLLVAGWWIARTRHHEAITAAVWAPIGMLLAVAINQPLVAAFHETRPYATLPHLLVLADTTTDPSFPSDHATMAGAVTAALLITHRRLGILAGVLAAAMAFSRVYVAAHYPHDVVTGLALGAVIAAGGYYLTRRPLAACIGYLSSTRLRPVFTTDPAELAPTGTTPGPPDQTITSS